jgi:hypothetical protein
VNNDILTFLLRSEYRNDLLSFDRQYKDLLTPSPDQDSKLELIQEEIIAENNVAFACFLAIHIQYKTYKMQDIVLSSDDPKYLFFFARCVPFANTASFQKALLASSHKDKLKYLTLFAIHIKEANRAKIEKELLIECAKKKKYASFAHQFLFHCPSIAPLKFKYIIFNSNKASYLYHFSRFINNKKDIAKIENILIFQKSYTYLRLLAKSHPLASFKKIENFFLNSGNKKEMRKFAKTFKKSKINKLIILL